MEFVDRTDESERLQRVINADKSAFVVVYGRRRLGKSTLIKRVLSTDDVYYLADESDATHQRTLLATMITQIIPDFDKVTYPDWETLFRTLNHRCNRRFTLCIDELPNMVKVSAELPSVLQKLLDEKILKFNLIICGSSQNLMYGLVLDATSPLYGRADAIIRLTPLKLPYLQEAMNLGDIETIEEYPDGEVVSYAYDKGGNLNTITTDKEGDKQTLLAEQRFDKYGNLTYRKMGNGTETKYDYDEKRLHLNTMSLMGNGVKMMENVYKYDNVDNILGISNAAAPSGEIGGTYSHSYAYDELNRLISASGTAKDKNYELLMRYDVMSNPLQKDSVSYEYNTPNHPNAVSSAGNKIFSYDANGNPISVEDTAANTLRVMQWDEENRLQSLGDDGYVSRYTYNHAGERVVKSHGPTTVAFVNGAPQGVLWHDKDNWTAYISPYMVVNADRFTKHYYAGSQRIASKIGVGEFNNLYDASKACVTAGQKDYAERMNLITQSRNDYYAALGIPPGPPTAKGIYGEAEYSGSYGDYTITPLGNYDVPDNWPRKPYKRPYGGTPSPPVMYEKASNPEDEGAGYGYKNAMRQQERDVFYYHSDHLGSTSYVTDKDGNVTQFVSYKPYGEALVDEHNTSYEQPWKFNGKELDSETGLYYYGARYYEPVLAMWYGVDALAEKYPNVGGYVYCHGNPIIRIDINGMSDDEPVTATGTFKVTLGVQFGFEIGVVSLDVNLASIELFSIESVDVNDDMHNTTTINYVGKEGQVRVDQEVSASVGIPVVGDVKAGYEQSFTTKGYGVAKTIQEPNASLDVDVTKVNLGAKCILGVEGELNYDWTSENTFVKGVKVLKELWNKYYK